MNHAVAILEEEECRLRAHVRRVEMNENEMMHNIDHSDIEEWLTEVGIALRILRMKKSKMMESETLRGLLAEMWKWQQACQELLPEGLADRVKEAIEENADG